MNATHTPTPWQVTPDGRARVRLVHVETSLDNPHGAGLPICSIPTARQYDAAFIVRACNAHDELVEVARAFISFLDDDSQSDRRRIACYEAAKAALAKAGA